MRLTFVETSRRFGNMGPNTEVKRKDSVHTKLHYYHMLLSLGPFSASSVSMDSARQNLASSFVNGFVNTAFGKDKLLTEDGNKWLYKNKEHGKSGRIPCANFSGGILYKERTERID